MKKYRIVRDRFLGYEVQKRLWFLPIWYQVSHELFHINTFKSIEEAEEFIKKVANENHIVKYLYIEDIK